MMWHMPVEDLLDLAIRHELAHAICNEYDESKADGGAITLKKWDGVVLPRNSGGKEPFQRNGKPPLTRPATLWLTGLHKLAPCIFPRVLAPRTYPQSPLRTFG